MSTNSSTLLTKSLIFVSVQVIILSFLFTFYKIEVPGVNYTTNWLIENSLKFERINDLIERIKYAIDFSLEFLRLGKNSTLKIDKPQGSLVLTHDQLALFDGTRPSKPIYLAILGRIYNVDKGKKHYGAGGGYNIFAGKDATRAFVTGDFSPAGLIDDVSDLDGNEILSISDWVTFYEREYEHVGFLLGPYYDGNGQPSQLIKDVENAIENAKVWKMKQLKEEEVFPSCNSEWKKGSGGRVWCTSKSGGIKRDWAGVPRKLFDLKEKSFRCACVKNFGDSLASPSSDSLTNRGDLDDSRLREFDSCPPDSNSCRISDQ